MSTIFHVLSNVRFNGQDIPKGSFVEAGAGEFDQLCEGNEPAMRVVPGATSIEEAQEIVARETAQAAEAAEEAAAAAPQDTWAPTKEVVDAPAETTTTTTDDTKVETEVVTPAPGEVGAGDQAPANAGDNL